MYQVIRDVRVWGEPVERGALDQAVTCRESADQVAMMADHHLGYAVPIGGVVVYKDSVSPSGVGYDIACGNKAVRLDVSADDVRRDIASIMDAIVGRISFGLGRTNETPVPHALFDRDDPRWKHPAVRPLKKMAADQLGTVGGGNHYVDLFVDERDRVWVGCHFGSRGLGHRTATWFLKAGGATDAIHARPLVLAAASPLGSDYIACMTLAGEYAYAGRDWVCAEVARILGATIVEEVHNHHNFAWQETHDGERVWVVRKGATPAFPGQRGFIGATMGEDAHIVVGVDGAESRAAFHSTVHGAGRAMSRREARRTVPREAMHEWVRNAGVELRGADRDESPQAYKRLADVLAHHAATIEIQHTLRPIGVAMAGPDVRDPYQD
jgi:tRNA-splicing ligase RtcB (3'-phosphate/5'-hydroxy nucleic acid ligase)